MSKYYKTINAYGQLTALKYTPVEGAGINISHTEYCMMKCAIKIFINGADAEKIKSEDWWK